MSREEKKKAARYSRESEPVERVPKVAQTTHFIEAVNLLVRASKVVANQIQIFPWCGKSAAD